MEKLRLNTQLFSENGTTTLNYDVLKDLANQIFNNLGPHIAGLFEEMVKSINSLINSNEFKSMTSNTIQTAVNMIGPYVDTFEDELRTFGSFLIKVVNSYELSDEALQKEFDQWGTTIQNSIKGVKSSFTAAPDGSYNFSTYFADMSNIAREEVGLATQAIVNTNKLVANLTGMSVQESLSKVASAAVGTFGTLLSGTAETATKYLGFLTGGIA